MPEVLLTDEQRASLTCREGVQLPPPYLPAKDAGQAERVNRLRSYAPNQQRETVRVRTFPDYSLGKSFRAAFVGLFTCAFFMGLIWLCAGGWAKFLPEEWTR